MRRLAPRDAPPTVSTVEEARMTLEERVSQWPRQRLMRRLAPRDAPPTVSTVEEARMTLEERVSQRPRQWLDRLAQVGDWIIECETGADLLARVRGGSRPGG